MHFKHRTTIGETSKAVGKEPKAPTSSTTSEAAENGAAKVANEAKDKEAEATASSVEAPEGTTSIKKTMTDAERAAARAARFGGSASG